MAINSILEKSLPNGFSIPTFGIGTWRLGGDMHRDPHNDDARDIESIHQAVANGVRHIDTAEIYAAGHAEKMVAEAIADFERNDLFLASKAFTTNLTAQGVLDAARRSLDRLKTSYLDLYMPHRVPRPENFTGVFESLLRLRDDGIIKHIGVSNFAVADLIRAQEVTGSAVVANQVHYNLKYREPEKDGLLTWCQNNSVILVAWRPMQYGAFTDNPPAILEAIAKRHSINSAQAALSWVSSQKNVVAISTTRRLSHLKENIQAVSVVLSSGEIEELREQFPDQEVISNAGPLGQY